MTQSLCGAPHACLLIPPASGRPELHTAQPLPEIHAAAYPCRVHSRAIPSGQIAWESLMPAHAVVANICTDLHCPRNACRDASPIFERMIEFAKVERT